MSRLIVPVLFLLLASTALEAQSPSRVVAEVQGYRSTPAAATPDEELPTWLEVRAGFSVGVFAAGLGSIRMMAVGDDGTIYVTRRDSGDVIALRDGGAGSAGPPRKVVTDLRGVHGITFQGGSLYLATIREIYRADVAADGSVGPPEPIVTDLPEGGQHPNRTLALGPDGMLYVSVGSTCNQCAETNRENATLVRMAPDGSRRGVFASGLRNTIGWGWHPETGELWGADHGSDWKGNAYPPEELNRIQAGGHYGWPFCQGNQEPDSLFSGEPEGSTKEQFCPGTGAPVLTFPAHAAPIGAAFYTGTLFPAEYRNDLFVALRGSWNREPPVGYKVVRVDFDDGRPTGVEDFLTGFLAEDGSRHFGRVAGVAVARDGALLVADDTNGIIYRVTHARGGE